MLTRLNVIAFVLGVCWLQQQAALPSLPWFLAFVFAALLILILVKWRLQRFLVLSRILFWLLFAGLGFFWAGCFAQWRLSDALPASLEQQDIRIIGVVASLPHSVHQGSKFLFEVEQVLTEDVQVPRRIALAWYRSPSRSARDGVDLPDVQAGERWQLTVRLKQPHGNANPHGFDYEVWALERNIRAVGYVRADSSNQRLSDMAHEPGYWVERLRADIQQRFKYHLDGKNYVGVLQALATGDQHAIPPDQWQVFIRTGTIHLMAISGLHITLISSLVYMLVFAMWRHCSGCSLFLPAHRVAVIAGLMAALGYAVLSGFAVPAQRSLYMLSVVALALWSGRMVSATSVLTWALLVVVIIDPWAVIAPGFWLSFGAVALIMLTTVGRIAKSHWLSGWVRIQWAITLGLIPLTLALFQQISIVSPIANALAIPLISLAVVPLVLLATLPWFEWLLPVAHALLSMGMDVLIWLNGLPVAVWQQHAPPLWTVITALGGVIWILLPGGLGAGFLTGFPARWLGFVALLPLFLIKPLKPETGELWLTVLDVGQGLAVVARTRHHALLFDTGPRFGDTDSGERIIMPFLRGEGIEYLDTLIVSHADMDHSGGAMSVLTALPVQRILSSLSSHHLLQSQGVQHDPCRVGESWYWDDVHFELLHPSEAEIAHGYGKTNASSCVLKITSAHGSILLPSDIGAAEEMELLHREPDKLQATILIAPHHGSNTSSTMTFIKQVDPKLTVFTVGYLNRYGHPREHVVERYRQIGSQVLRTDLHGAVLLRFSSQRWSFDHWRQLHRRYWQQDKASRIDY